MTRERAIKELTELLPEEFLMEYSETIRMAIEALSSSENPNKWIPCSERLPEVGQRIIATIESIDGNYVRETIYDKHGFLCGKGIAWMYIPEPYLPDINVGNMSEIPTGAEEVRNEE